MGKKRKSKRKSKGTLRRKKTVQQGMSSAIKCILTEGSPSIDKDAGVFIRGIDVILLGMISSALHQEFGELTTWHVPLTSSNEFFGLLIIGINHEELQKFMKEYGFID